MTRNQELSSSKIGLSTHHLIEVPRGLLTPSRQMLGEYFKLYTMASLYFLSIPLLITVMGKWDKVVSLVIRERAGRFRVRISSGSK
jgi:hypothetical protein